MANITPGSFVAPTQVEHRLYQPNFEMMLKSIQANQKFYDASMAKVNEVVDVLPGDVTERDVIAKGFSDRSEQVTDAYMQDVGRGSTNMRQLIRDIEKQNRPGGKYFEWKKKYQMWSEHQKTQKKRLDEGKIRQSQYWDSVMKPIQGYKTFGEDGSINPLNLMGSADATDFHKMAMDLVKEKEAQLTETWGKPQRIGGNIVWAHDTVNEIRYDDLMQEVSAALMAKGERPNTDPLVKNKLMTMASTPELRSQFMQTDLTDYITKLSPSDYNSFLSMRKSIQEGSSKHDVEYGKFLSDTAVIKNVMAASGISGDKREAEFTNIVMQAAVEWQRVNQKKDIPNDELYKLASRYALDVEVKGRLYDPDKKVYQIQPGEKLLIPQDFLEGMRLAYKKRGLVYPEKNLEKVKADYLDYLSKKGK